MSTGAIPSSSASAPIGVGVSACLRPTGRRWRRHDTDKLDLEVPGEAAQSGNAERAAAEEDGPDPMRSVSSRDRGLSLRRRGAIGPKVHARALVASRTSASSSSSWPTGISSSIESR